MRKALSDREIMGIMHAHHAGFRTGNYQVNPDLLLMADEEFLTELHKIVPLGKKVVNGEQATAIYNLRAQWQLMEHQGFNSSTIRLQAMQKRIVKLSPEEEIRELGMVLPRTSSFWLEDVLGIPLGRWPASKRLPIMPKRSLGRPKKSDIQPTQRRDARERQKKTQKNGEEENGSQLSAGRNGNITAPRRN